MKNKNNRTVAIMVDGDLCVWVLAGVAVANVFRLGALGWSSGLLTHD